MAAVYENSTEEITHKVPRTPPKVNVQKHGALITKKDYIQHLVSQRKDKNTKTQKKIDKKGGWWEKNKAKIKAAEAKFVMSGLTPMKVAQLDGFIRSRTGAAPKGKNKAEKLVEARGLRQAGRGNRSQLEIQRSYAQVYIEGLGPAYQRRTRHWRTKNNFNSDDPRWNQVWSQN